MNYATKNWRMWFFRLVLESVSRLTLIISPDSIPLSSPSAKYRRFRLVGVTGCVFIKPSTPFSDQNSEDCPDGVIPLPELQRLEMDSRSNPFESPNSTPLSSSPSLSDEELYTDALTLQAPIAPVQAPSRRPAPPPPGHIKNTRNEQANNS